MEFATNFLNKQGREGDDTWYPVFGDRRRLKKRLSLNWNVMYRISTVLMEEDQKAE